MHEMESIHKTFSTVQTEDTFKLQQADFIYALKIGHETWRHSQRAWQSNVEIWMWLHY